MIPSGFDYTAPDSLDEALKALADGGDEAKILAGGHSLIPLMKMRLAKPGLLVDLRKLSDLRGIQPGDATARIGAMTTHAEVSQASELGVAAHAAAQIADQQVRNRGTIGGSLPPRDPSSHTPARLVA